MTLRNKPRNRLYMSGLALAFISYSFFVPAVDAQTIAEIALDLQLSAITSAKARPLILSLDQNRTIRQRILTILSNTEYQQQQILTESGSADTLIIIDRQPSMVEYRQINYTKYRLRVHGAREAFPLVLQQMYHQGWNAYLMPSWPASEITDIQIRNYQILAANADDQATSEEIKDYATRGIISTLGDGQPKVRQYDGSSPESYYSEYVSKIRDRRIQNNNLPADSFYETLLRKPLPAEQHWLVDGFANGWWIDVDAIRKSGSCLLNPDGSIDFEVVLEFQPQKIFYLGYFITGLTFLGCSIMLLRKYFSRPTTSRNKPGTPAHI